MLREIAAGRSSTRREIAALLGFPPTTVQRRVYQAAGLGILEQPKRWAKRGDWFFLTPFGEHLFERIRSGRAKVYFTRYMAISRNPASKLSNVTYRQVLPAEFVSVCATIRDDGQQFVSRANKATPAA